MIFRTAFSFLINRTEKGELLVFMPHLLFLLSIFVFPDLLAALFYDTTHYIENLRIKIEVSFYY